MSSARDNEQRLSNAAEPLAARQEVYDDYARSAPGYIQAAARRAAGQPIVDHHRRLLELACYDEQVAEQIAGQHSHDGLLGGYGPLLVISLTGVAETALAYFGLTLAVPNSAQTGNDWLLSFVSQDGAYLAAIAIGVLSTAVTAVVGRQLSLAHRSLVAEPSQHGRRTKGAS